MAAISLTSAFLLLFLLFIIYQLFRFLRLRSVINALPGPAGVPILGNAHRFIGGNPADILDNIIEMVAESGSGPHGFMRLWLAQNPYIFAFHPDTVEPVLNGSKHITKSYDYELLVPWLGRGLLISNGKKWSFRRKLLTPSFHFKVLTDYAYVMQQKCRTFQECLFTAAEENPNGFNISPFISRAALDIICQTAMGVSVEAQLNPENQYLKDVLRISEILFLRGVKPWLWNPLMNFVIGTGWEEIKLVKKLHHFTNTVIRERKANFINVKKDKSVRLSFLDTLLSVADEHGLTDEDIREEVDTFMFEGHDTTAAGMSWAMYLIGKHEDVQRKIHEEIDRVFSEAEDPEELSQDDLRKMTYLEWTIKESLRLFPSVPFFFRKVDEDIKYASGKTIPPGAYFCVVTYLLHRNPEIWPDPDKFDPERFNPANSANRHPYAYVPFSAGPRNCIGQKFALLEEKITLSSALRHFEVLTLKDCHPSPEVILKAEPGVFVKLTRRFQ